MNKIVSIVFFAFITISLFHACKEECDPLYENCDGDLELCAFDCAIEIAPGEVYLDKIEEASKVDYFSINLSEVAVVDFNIESPADLNLVIDVFGPLNSQESIESVDLDAGESLNLVLGPFGTGIHYIRIQSENAQLSQDNYSLSYTLDLSDSQELNNDFESATIVSTGESIMGKLRGRKDVDFYRFEIPTAGVLNVSVAEVPEDLFMNVSLYSDKDEDALVRTVGAESGNSINFLEDLNNVQDYYLKCWTFPYNKHSEDPYLLNVDFDSSTTVPNEYNSFEDAFQVSDGIAVQNTIAYPDENDFFYINAGTYANVTVELYDVPDDLNMFINIYDTAFSLLEFSENPGGESLTLSAGVDYIAATFYIRVGAYTGQSSNEPYSIRITRF